MSEIAIRSFELSDQAAVRALVLAGLKDHFGELDPALNHDLNDISTTYVAQGGIVIVATIDGEIVGTGTMIPVEPGVVRLTRMSVSGRFRAKGIGKRLVHHLVGIARARGDHRVLVETNDDWTDAITLYRSCGFGDEHLRNGDIHFSLGLQNEMRDKS